MVTVAGLEAKFERFCAHLRLTVVVELLQKATYPTYGNRTPAGAAGVGNFFGGKINYLRG